MQGQLAPIGGNSGAVHDGAAVSHVGAMASFLGETVDKAQGGSAGEPQRGRDGVEFSSPAVEDRGHGGGRERLSPH